MSSYKPPIEDMLFTLNHVVNMSQLPQMKDGELDGDMVEAV